YPASFLDANGDGTGDLAGITEKLDHLKNLGMDVIWLSPIYRSSLADTGYDMTLNHSRYGTLEDWDRLLEGAHTRGMKLMMALVVNHTSDEASPLNLYLSGETDPKRDWYIWRSDKVIDGKELPPNNWKGVFQGG
ncbi:alpha-glucosidase, partial [Suillus occidentalis]